ncbi:MAG: hypothetical protein HYT77_02295 [Deltaproteobacteria bacterium]|nr:hypothetical protein [Deltaproteobacteria bacterium]
MARNHANIPHDSGGKTDSEVHDSQGDSLDPTPPSKIDLRDAHAVRRELASVYRDMRSGKIESQHGTRLSYVLDLLRRAYETAVLQERLELLERTIDHRRNCP